MYLLEIGTEELPVDFMVEVQHTLKEAIIKALNESLVPFREDSFSVYVTPRRIVVMIPDITDRANYRAEVIKGPPMDRALNDDGSYTKAAINFAKKYNTTPDKLAKEVFRKKNQKGGVEEKEHLIFRIRKGGEHTEDILEKVVQDAVYSLSGDRWMHWNEWTKENNKKFPRPVRWVVSLFDDTHVKIELFGVKSGTTTYAHRNFTPPEGLSVETYRDYLDIMNEYNVILDPEKRKGMISKETSTLIGTHRVSGLDDPSSATLKEMECEYPYCLYLNIDEEFLNLPYSVIKSVVEGVQGYMLYMSSPGSKKIKCAVLTDLGPRDYRSDWQTKRVENIASGHERVLKARLKDAKFFYEKDKERSLTEYRVDLQKVEYLRGAKTLFHKTQRLLESSRFFSRKLNLLFQDEKHLAKAAELCKSDLCTGIVREFTELQGAAGGVYARAEGLPDEACKAIELQYNPVSINDPVKHWHPVSKALSVMDRLDDLVVAFSVEGIQLPTGSKDPGGLRRKTIGLVRVLGEDYTEELIKELVVYVSGKVRLSLYDCKLRDETIAIKQVIAFIQARKEYLDSKVPGCSSDG